MGWLFERPWAFCWCSRTPGVIPSIEFERAHCFSWIDLAVSGVLAIIVLLIVVSMFRSDDH